MQQHSASNNKRRFANQLEPWDHLDRWYFYHFIPIRKTNVKGDHLFAVSVMCRPLLHAPIFTCITLPACCHEALSRYGKLQEYMIKIYVQTLFHLLFPQFPVGSTCSLNATIANFSLTLSSTLDLFAQQMNSPLSPSKLFSPRIHNPGLGCFCTISVIWFESWSNFAVSFGKSWEL